MSIKFTIKALPDFKEGVKKAEAVFGTKAISALVEVESHVRSKAARKTPVDTSRLVNSIRATQGRDVIPIGKLSKKMKRNLPRKKDVVRVVESDGRRLSLTFGTKVPYSELVDVRTGFFSSAVNGSASRARSILSKIQL